VDRNFTGYMNIVLDQSRRFVVEPVPEVWYWWGTLTWWIWHPATT